MALPFSLTGGGGLSSSEAGDAISGLGGVHQTFAGIGKSPLSKGPFGLSDEAMTALAIAVAIVAAIALYRFVVRG